MVVEKATTSTSSRASSSRLPPAPMTLGTSTRFLLVATRAPDRRMQSHSGYAYYKPSPWTSSKTSSSRSARSRHLSAQCKPIVSAHKIGAGKPLASLWWRWHLGRKPHATARIHHAAWGRGVCVAGRGASGAACDASDMVPQPPIAREFAEPNARIPPGLKDVGYVESEKVAIEYRWANNQFDRPPELAAQLVRRR